MVILIMPRRKIDLKKMDYNQILDYINNLRRERNNYRANYIKANQRVEDLLLKYEPSKKEQPKNKYFIDDFVLNLNT
jgi:hypothetical protein